MSNPPILEPEFAAEGGFASAESGLSRTRARIEGPTWMVIGAIYGGWVAVLVAASAWMPLWAALTMLAVLVTWHGHLQHEILHGHPTRNAFLNALLGLPPLGLFYPYSVFKRSHLDHHRAAELSSPDGDVESFYVTPETWARFGRIRRTLLIVNNTMLGRFLLGPLLSLPPFFVGQLRRILSGDPVAAREWALHGVLVAGLLYGVQTYAGIDAWLYLVAVAYPGHGLLMIRSYAEHRPSAVADERTAIVEGNWFFSLLYLCNNLHVVHHEHPGMPWYEIPGYFKVHRDDILRRNGGYRFRSYGDLARRFLLKPKDHPVYPV